MASTLPAFAAQPEHTFVVTLGAAQFQVRMVYRYRLSAWYLDLRTAAGDAVALGRRVSPGWGPLVGLSLPDGPDGVLWVRGPDGYDREDLGDALEVLFIPAAEMPSAAPASLVSVELDP